VFIIYNLKIGQYLITTTNEKVIIVEITNDTIKVNYRGKIYSRPKSIVGEKLFLIVEDQKISNINIIQFNKKVDDRNNKKENETLMKDKTCKDCMSYRIDDCFGEEKICSYFKYAPYSRWKDE